MQLYGNKIEREQGTLFSPKLSLCHGGGGVESPTINIRVAIQICYLLGRGIESLYACANKQGGTLPLLVREQATHTSTYTHDTAVAMMNAVHYIASFP